MFRRRRDDTSGEQRTELKLTVSQPAGPPAAGAGVDVGQASQTLANLSSYQAHTQTPAQSADIVVVRSPTLAESIVATVGTRRERLVVIGSDVWRDAGTGTFIKNAITPGTAAGILGLFDPGAIVTAFAKEHPLTGLVEVGRESRNGVDTVHFHGDPSSTGGGGATIPAGGVIDVWVASQGGELVGLEATGLKLSGKSGTVSIELSHINDPAIAVQPPG